MKIDLKQLSQINLNKIDSKQISNYLTEHKEVAINAGIVFVAFILASNVLSGHKKQGKVLQAEILKMQDKTNVIKKNDNVLSEIKTFMNSFPQSITKDELVDYVVSYALDNNVQIISFSPATNISDTLYEKVVIEVSLSAENYDDMVSFLHTLEIAPEPWRVESFTSSLQSAFVDKNSGIKDEKERIAFKITLATVQLSQVSQSQTKK